MTQAIHYLEAEPESDTHLPAKFDGKMGISEWRALGDHFGLRQFGVNIETLYPGAQSSLRHWHSKTDEFIFMLDGELTLVCDDSESILTHGMCIGFPAGVDNGHHLINKSASPASFLVAGSRVEGDEVHYPDDDLQWLTDKDGRKRAGKKNGSFY